ncbi:VSR7 [Symbiodinium sp. KB8]|nr:VSR7 [Symbiodinium sp. KB8]
MKGVAVYVINDARQCQGSFEVVGAKLDLGSVRSIDRKEHSDEGEAYHETYRDEGSTIRCNLLVNMLEYRERVVDTSVPLKQVMFEDVYVASLPKQTSQVEGTHSDRSALCSPAMASGCFMCNRWTLPLLAWSLPGHAMAIGLKRSFTPEDCGLTDAACPGSPVPSGDHAACSESLVFKASCSSVQEEIEARIGLNMDRKKLPGNYTLLASETGVCTKASRATSPFADPGPFTDLFGFRYVTDGSDCHVLACSESQVKSLCDFSTNFCNLFNLYCNEADGCEIVHSNLEHDPAQFDQSCDHTAKCGGYETLAAECTRRKMRGAVSAQESLGSCQKHEGLIRGYTVEGNRITILLKHYQGAPVIRNIRVVSKPSRDIWLLPHELKFRTRYNTGLWILQTPVGVVSHRDCIEMGIGGKVSFWAALTWLLPLAPQQATAQVCERAFLSVPFLSRFMASFSGCSCAVAVRVVAPRNLKEEFQQTGGRIDGSTATFGAPFYGDSFLGRLVYGDSKGELHCTDGDYDVPEPSEYTPEGKSYKEVSLINIVLVERGGCSFVTKVKVARRKHAHAVIIVDKKDSTLTSQDIRNIIVADDGYGSNINIPSVLISRQAAMLCYAEAVSAFHPLQSLSISISGFPKMLRVRFRRIERKSEALYNGTTMQDTN